MNNLTFLDKRLIDELRSKLNESPIFSEDNSLKDNYDLICAVLDRLDSSVDYLNNHSEIPRKEHDFLVFMMYSSMVKDASKQLADGLEVPYPFLDPNDDNNFKFFKSFCMGKPLNLDEQIVPTDDRFFEYFRSIAFAHPFETSRANFLKKNDKEIHYSPFVLVNNHVLSSFEDIKDAVGVRVYTNKAEGWASILDVKISFATLKNFVISRFNFLEEIINWAQEQINNFEMIWGKRKVNRSLTNLEILEDIIDILSTRYESTYEIESLLEYLGCEVSLATNQKSVAKFRNMIDSHIPKLCDAIDNFNYDVIYSTINADIEVHPREDVENMADYQIQKIFSYLNDEEGYNNILWGLKMAEEFSQGFAKEFVTINPRSMSFSEIKLLVRTACYLKNEQQKIG